MGSRFEQAVREAESIREAYLRKTDTPATILAEYYAVFSDRLSELIEPSTEDRTEGDALSLIAKRLLRDGKPLPDALAGWVADVLEQRRPRPVRQGRPPNWLRNQAITWAVRQLVWAGLKPTRSIAKGEESGAEGGSACDAVGVAFGFKYRRVADVWERRDRGSDQ